MVKIFTIVLTLLLQTVFVFNPYDFELACPLDSCARVTQWAHEEHMAVDLGGDIGDPIYAAGRGEIYKAGWDCRTDPCALRVTMLHGYGRLATNYWHMDEVFVEPGDMVDVGDQIGTVGMTGLTSGPHLHFSVQVDREHVDPELFLDLQ